jgi:hypothetical protein
VNYFTEVKFEESRKKFDYRSRLLFLGSCFSENIGEWLKDLRFQTRINPFGITYNPVSIARQISYSLEGKPFPGEHEIAYLGKTVHLDLHKDIAGEERILQLGKTLKADLLNSSHLFLTFGTSFAFRYRKTGKIINNCHKIPGSEFEKVLLNENEMCKVLEEALEKVFEANKALKVFVTVSPIRHLRHGAIDNQRSKARLIRLCEMLESRYDRVDYIPIYELVMDELRDYRFYRSDDLLHLNQLGLEIVKNRIRDYYIDSKSYDLMDRVSKWLKMKNHRLLDYKSHESKKFLAKLQAETAELEKIFLGLQSLDR